MLTRDFSGIATWIFDLDETLYPPSAGLLAQVDARMTAYIARELGLAEAEADRLRRLYWRDHGITLAGLVRHHAVAPAHFLEEVHSIELDGLAPDPGLAAALAGLPGRRIVHTNAARAHAERVLEALGLAGEIAAVYALEDKGLVAKPAAGAYAHVLAAEAAAAAETAMVEDSARNLREPHRLGMATVWLDHLREGPTPEHVDHRTHDLARFLRMAARRRDCGDAPTR